ncbi:MAG: disulfide bond formation protein B [Gammaproteobacteria bacterium]
MNVTRLFYLAVFTGCLGLLVFGLYLEHGTGLEPCPLCIFQRIAYIVVMLIALLAAIHHPAGWGRYVYAALTVITAGIGAGIAGRQTWLQHLPADQVPECGPGLEYMLEVFPLAQALELVLKGSGECAEVQWTFLGFSIAEWSLVCFSLIILATLIITFIIKPGKQTA